MKGKVLDDEKMPVRLTARGVASRGDSGVLS
jgi:hypothetical protein